MKKIAKLTSCSLLLGLVGLISFTACNTTSSSSSVPGGEDRPPFGITTRPDNDFEDDPNRHDREPVEKVLTLKGGATFADGTTSKTILSNTELVIGKDILLDIPEGKVVTGWLADDPNNPNLYGDFYAGANFVTIRKDATIQPVLDVPSEAYASQTVAEGEEPTYGKLSDFAWEQRTDDPQTTQNAYLYSDTLTTVTVNDEAGVYFHADGGTFETLNKDLKVPGGWHTMFLSRYQVIDTESYAITYTIENFGDEAVDLKLYQTNSSGNVLNEANASAPIHIEPNSVGTVFTSFSGWTNGNTLVTMELINPVEELKVGIYGYVEDYETIENKTLTLTEGDIIEEDASIGQTKDYKPGSAVTLSSENVTVPADSLFIGWQDTADENQVYPSSFNMPNKDITLSPYFESKAEHTHTVTLGENLTFSDGTNTKDLVWNDVLDLAAITYSGETKPGQQIIYTIEADGINYELSALDDLTMPDSDVTISFARAEIVYSSTNGKISLPPNQADSGDNPHKWRGGTTSQMISHGETSINGSWSTSYASVCYASSVMINEEEAALYDLYGYDGTIDAETETIAPEAIFMMQINHQAYIGTYNDVATVQNFGEEPITIKIHNSLSSGDYDQAGSSEAVTIQPNEIVKIPYTVTYNKKNSSEMVSIQYAGSTPIANMKLGIYIYRTPAQA